MKRYQCIKTWTTFEHDIISVFTHGNLYPGAEGMPLWPDGGRLVDGNGLIVEVSAGTMFDHFKELEDLNVDSFEEDHDAAEYDRFLSGLPSLKGVVYIIAAVITTALFLYAAITWRS